MDVKKPNIDDYDDDMDGISQFVYDAVIWMNAHPDGNIVPTPFGDFIVEVVDTDA
tara:strand:+ start:211 stop:375 length:165 start_codon:yes stop_codon:yes gene_type:complete